ncbi:hypothetical protein [Natrinema sp. 1APR25-10V2]|uniref:hypothetical protein n=1 Tax=Natrinema sp. 1APR25-10V2 TaxID=2951081 RepID=UPI002875150A|nr:hypothetical protein [Natrinema sp. 1APR25-10V2]MDS0474397.1 hypothetical protein [Natrinema sp. 1APR25-10V2]
MPAREPFGQRGRFLAGVVLLTALLVLLWWTGAAAATPLEEAYPNEVEVTSNRDAYVGERVVLGGFVVETDPVVIATRASGYGRFTVVNADDSRLQSTAPLERGDDVTVFGTLADESTLEADRTVTDELRDTLYMFAVSFVGGCWVLVRLVRGWRIDRDRFALVPRTATPPTAGRRDGDTGSSLEAVAGSSERARSRPGRDRQRNGTGGDR